MNRIDRLAAISIFLQGKPRVTIDTLTERFEVSKRTIFRDIKSLMEAGMPIGGDAGEGYFVVKEYHLPPVVFTKDEASALVIGAKFTEQNSDKGTNKQVKSAMDKVRAVLRHTDKSYLEFLENNIAVIGTPSISKIDFPESHLLQIKNALANGQVIVVNYYANYRNEHTERAVEPVGLVYYSHRWHLIAYCRMRKQMRDFRADRIQNLKLTTDHFERGSNHDLQNYLATRVEKEKIIEVKVAINNEVVRFLQDQKYYFGFVEEVRHEHETVMTFTTPHLSFIAQWIMGMTKNARVIYPSALSDMIYSMGEELLSHYKKSEIVKSE